MIKRLNQKGMASLMFAIFMVVILALLAIGFGTIVRNDQRQTVDKSLSNQAQYAAETAINRTASELQKAARSGTPITSKNDCTNPPDLVDGAQDPQLNDVVITCLKWNATPTVLRADNVANSPAVFPLIPVSGSITTINVSWQPSDNVNNSVYGAGVSQLNLVGGNVPTLRVTVGEIANIATNTRVMYAVPTAAAGTYTAAALSNSGGIGNARCTGGGTVNVTCTITLTMPASLTTRDMISISSLNGASNIQVTPRNGVSPVQLTNAQVQIDATAKSQDVIKRLVASISLLTNTWLPGFSASASKQLCKNYYLDGSTNALPGPAGNYCGVTPPANGAQPGDVVDLGSDNLSVGGVIGGGGTQASKTNPKWNLAAQIIVVSFTPTNCTYELTYRDTDGKAPNYGNWSATFSESIPTNCTVGHSHRFRFSPGSPCDSIIGASRCGLPGTYDIKVCVYGAGNKKLCDNRGSSFLPYTPYP